MEKYNEVVAKASENKKQEKPAKNKRFRLELKKGA